MSPPLPISKSKGNLLPYPIRAAPHISEKRRLIFLRIFQVIQNPGTPPDAPLANIGPDLILTCEEPYSRYRSNEVQQRLRQLHYDRARCGFMIHSVPRDDLRPLVHDLRHRAAYLFVTELFGEFYERFGPSSWTTMVEASQSEA